MRGQSCGRGASGGNDHYYEFIQVPNPFSGTNNAWATAEAAADASVFDGSRHLATVTSQAENTFILSLTGSSFSQFTGAWLGGKSPEGWLDGPEVGQLFTYTNWGGVEPNNSGQVYINLSTETISGSDPVNGRTTPGLVGLAMATASRTSSLIWSKGTWSSTRGRQSFRNLPRGYCWAPASSASRYSSWAERCAAADRPRE